MKKVALLSVVFILLAVSVVPVMAAKGGSNGQGNGRGHGAGQSTGMGDQDRSRDQEQLRLHTSNGNTSHEAHGNTLKMRRMPFYLQGTVEAVGANSVTVKVIHANAKAKQYIGTTLIVQTTINTLIYKHTQGDENTSSTTNDEGEKNKVIIPLAELEKGRIVAIHGNLVDGVYTARLITEYLGNFLGEAPGTP